MVTGKVQSVCSFCSWVLFSFFLGLLAGHFMILYLHRYWTANTLEAFDNMLLFFVLDSIHSSCHRIGETLCNPDMCQNVTQEVFVLAHCFAGRGHGRGHSPFQQQRK